VVNIRLGGFLQMARTRSLVSDESGATAVEYGLIIAAIAGVILIVVILLGNKVNNMLNNVAGAIPG
jgi:pilus assembly protein Flp/PilA